MPIIKKEAAVAPRFPTLLAPVDRSPSFTGSPGAPFETIFSGDAMTEREVLEIGRAGLIVALKLSLPVLLFGLVAGVMVSIFQAVTQIQEFTLTFVPKLLAVILALAIFGPWMISTMTHFIQHTYSHMPPVLH